MKTMVKFIKKAAKWYFDKAAQSYVWTPSCTIPVKYLSKKD